MKTLAFIFCLVLPGHAVQAQQDRFAATDFTKADSVAARYPKHSLKNLKELADKLTLPLATEEEKFRSIYKWVCNNIAYDYALNQQNQTQRAKAKTEAERKAWNDKVQPRVFQTLLTKQRSVCTGYAYLIRELSTLAGIPCVIIDGYGRTARSNIGGSGITNHSWNAVQLYGRWYLCDATWSTGAYDLVQNQFLRNYNNAYFLADPELFIRNHYPLDSAWTLLTTNPSLHSFLNRPLIYVDAYTYNIREFSPDSFNITATKGDTVSFQFNSLERAIPKPQLIIKRGSRVATLSKPLVQQSPGKYALDHVFKSKGNHTVHVLLDSKYIVTYEVIVR